MTERPGAADLPAILLAGDERPLRELLAGALSRKFRVLQAQNGVEALAAFAQHRDDVVLFISGIAMSQMNGGIPGKDRANHRALTDPADVRGNHRSRLRHNFTAVQAINYKS